MDMAMRHSHALCSWHVHVHRSRAWTYAYGPRHAAAQLQVPAGAVLGAAKFTGQVTASLISGAALLAALLAVAATLLSLFVQSRRVRARAWPVLVPALSSVATAIVAWYVAITHALCMHGAC